MRDIVTIAGLESGPSFPIIFIGNDRDDNQFSVLLINWGINVKGESEYIVIPGQLRILQDVEQNGTIRNYAIENGEETGTTAHKCDSQTEK